MDDTLAWEDASMVVVDMPLGAEAGSAHGLLGEPVVVGSGSALVSQDLVPEQEKTPFAEVASSFLI
jgi:hypothetical protein